MRAARTPPEPAPMTKRSTSWSAISRRHHIIRTIAPVIGDNPLKRVTPLLQFVAHFRDNLVGERVCPVLRKFQAFLTDFRLLGEQLHADWGLVERQYLFELRFGEVGSVQFGHFGR